jgi:hypothetical protein
MDREKQLSELKKDPKLCRLVEEMLKLEADLDKLEALPKFRVNPKDKSQVKVSPAFYAYHRTLSSYKEIVRVLSKISGEDENEISPLRQYLNSINGND